MHCLAMVLKDYIILVLYLIFSKCDGSTMEPFIVGGDYAKIDYFPHSVFLGAECDKDSWICGSSVLNQKVLLTAAHCLHGCKKKFTVDAYAGNSNLERVSIIRKVQKLTVHENYNEQTVYSDIALAWLQTNLPLGKNIKRVIVLRYFPVGLKNAQVAGWGTVDDRTGEGTLKLKRVKQQMRASRTCAISVGKLKNGMMCASSILTNNRPSEGDSGSALITSNFEQVGLVSFRGNTQKDLVIYTNVTYFYPWIEKMSKLLACSGK